MEAVERSDDDTFARRVEGRSRELLDRRQVSRIVEELAHLETAFIV